MPLFSKTKTKTQAPARRTALSCLLMEDRLTPAAHLFAVGADAGNLPEVHVYDAAGQLRYSIPAYESSFTGGVRVATGDVTGDGTDDIVTVPGGGGAPRVRVFDGATGGEVQSFFADASTARVGLTVAVADVTGDGKADVVTGTGYGGGPRVTVIDGASGAVVKDFFAYDSSVRGGVNVAAADVTGDGKADLVVAPGEGGPHVKVIDGVTGAEVRSFFAYDAGFTGGVSVAAADVTGDGRADVVTGAGYGGGPEVKVIDGQTGAVVRSTLAFGAGFRGGVNVAAVDLNGDGRAEVIAAAGPGGGAIVNVFDGQSGAFDDSFAAFGIFVDGVTTGNGVHVPPPAPTPPPAPAANPYPGIYDYIHVLDGLADATFVPAIIV